MIRFKPWPGIIFVLLAGNVVIVIITIVAAAISHSPVEPDYYRRAVEWDQVKSLRADTPPWVVTASRDAQGLRLSLTSCRDSSSAPYNTRRAARTSTMPCKQQSGSRVS